MANSLVRKDARGLFIRTGGYVFRPGAINGYQHAVRMDDGQLQDGDHVKASHVGGTPLAKLTLGDGSVTRWAEESVLAKDGAAPPTDAIWLPNGQRDTGRR